MHRSPLPYAAVVLLSIAACSTTSDSFIERYPGYSVTKGRLLRVENLSSTTVTALSDGAAFTVDAPRCRVTLRFQDGGERSLDLQPPAVLICGTDRDVVLQPAMDSRPAAPAPTDRQ